MDTAVTLNFRIPESEVQRVYTLKRDYRANLEKFMVDRFKCEMGKMNITLVAAHRGDVSLAVKTILEDGARDGADLYGSAPIPFLNIAPSPEGTDETAATQPRAVKR